MKEEFLHYVWKLKRFDLQDLTSYSGEKIRIVNFGTHNMNAGPDFLDARISVGDKLWAGHVEIHINSSDWYNHKHHFDRAYDNVILHVVYNNDRPVFNSDEQQIPCLELKTRVSQRLIESYNDIRRSLDWIPCAAQINKIDSHMAHLFLERTFVERLLRKSLKISDMLEYNKHDWESTLYSLLLRYLGLKVNGEAFERLAEVLKYNVLKKYSDKLFQLEALLLGQAGLLKNVDSYTNKLIKEYEFLKQKHHLIPMKGLEWKFSRLRPANFPTVRIAQVAMLIHQTPRLFTKITKINGPDDLDNILSVTASEYWNTHYIPGKKSPKRIKLLGSSTRRNIIINVITPIIFTYARKIHDDDLKEKAIELLYNVPSEKNRIIKRWNTYGIESKSAAESQALIELKSNYCDQFRCLKCSIGQQVLFS